MKNNFFFVIRKNKLFYIIVEKESTLMISTRCKRKNLPLVDGNIFDVTILCVSGIYTVKNLLCVSR